MTTIHEQRLAQPSACRWCGQTCRDTDRVADWRVCRRCRAITEAVRADAGHAALWTAITGDRTITEAEGRALTGVLDVNPAFYATTRDPSTWWASGTGKPWEHLRKGLADDAKGALRRLRDSTAVRKHRKGPCCICGAVRDDAWVEPQSENGDPVCGACERVLRRCGWPSRRSDAHADAVTAACLGFEPATGMGRQVPVATYGDHVPGGPGGDPWCHVDPQDRSRARIMLAAGHPRWWRSLTDDERATALTQAQAARVAAEWAALNAEPEPAIRVRA